MSCFLKAAFLTIVLACAGAPAALAGPAEQPYARSISIAGLDLDTEAGAATAMLRIKAASESVCGASPSLRQLKAVGLHQKCKQDFASRAVQAIGSTRLFALYERSGAMKLASR